MAGTGAFYEALGRRIQAFRRGRLTQEQLASRLEPPLTRAAIANIEAGKQGVLVHTLVQIARHLGVAPAKLLPSDAIDGEQRKQQLESEFGGLSVPAETLKRLKHRMLADNAREGRQREQRSGRKNRS